MFQFLLRSPQETFDVVALGLILQHHQSTDGFDCPIFFESPTVRSPIGHLMPLELAEQIPEYSRSSRSGLNRWLSSRDSGWIGYKDKIDQMLLRRGLVDELEAIHDSYLYWAEVGKKSLGFNHRGRCELSRLALKFNLDDSVVWFEDVGPQQFARAERGAA